jgi:hypothetical protein
MGQMPADTVQMQLIRRYARVLREQHARALTARGPRIGAKERREAREQAAGAMAEAVGEVAAPPRVALPRG